jgi:hypothetical protein
MLTEYSHSQGPFEARALAWIAYGLRSHPMGPDNVNLRWEFPLMRVHVVPDNVGGRAIGAALAPLFA